MSTVTTLYKGDMLFESQMGNYTLTIDVPEAIGGRDRGPMPPQLFLASLGSCVGVYIAQYCDEHGIDTTGMKVDVSCDKGDGCLENVVIDVDMPNATLDKRATAIKRVAEHCLVHETIRQHKDIVMNIHDKSALEPA